MLGTRRNSESSWGAGLAPHVQGQSGRPAPGQALEGQSGPGHSRCQSQPWKQYPWRLPLPRGVGSKAKRTRSEPGGRGQAAGPHSPSDPPWEGSEGLSRSAGLAKSETVTFGGLRGRLPWGAGRCSARRSTLAPKLPPPAFSFPEPLVHPLPPALNGSEAAPGPRLSPPGRAEEPPVQAASSPW